MVERSESHSFGFAPQTSLKGAWLEDLSANITARGEPTQQQALAQAVALYRANSNHPDALYTLGMLAKQIARRELAAGLIQKALDQAPNRIDFIGDLGNVYSEMGRFGEAIACYRKVLSVHPDMALAHNNLGNTLQEQGDLEQAIASYRQAIALKPDYAEAWTNLGNTLEKNGAFEYAVEAFHKALEIRPNYLQAKVNLGVAYHIQGDVEQAIACLEACLAQNPRLLSAAMRLQRIYLEQGLYDKARRCYTHIKAIAPGNQTAIAAEAVCHLEAGDGDRFDYIYRPQSLPRELPFDVPDGYDDLAGFNRALADEIQSHPSLKWIHDTHDTSKRGFVYGLLESPPPAIEAFIAQLDRSLEDFKTDLPEDPGHPFFGRVPAKTTVNLWATLLNSGGWHPAHFHEHNWLSGVYYVAMPEMTAQQDSEHQGWIEFDGFTHLPGLDGHADRVKQIQPRPGKLVLFPSYLMHGTRPFDSSGLRISVAFDVKPL